MSDDTFSPGQLLCDYTERKGYGHPTKAAEAVALLEIHEPDLAAFIIKTKDDWSQVDHWPDFLEEPPALLVRGDEIVLTEHGRRLSERYRREIADAD